MSQDANTDQNPPLPQLGMQGQCTPQAEKSGRILLYAWTVENASPPPHATSTYGILLQQPFAPIIPTSVTHTAAENRPHFWVTTNQSTEQKVQRIPQQLPQLTTLCSPAGESYCEGSPKGEVHSLGTGRVP